MSLFGFSIIRTRKLNTMKLDLYALEKQIESERMTNKRLRIELLNATARLEEVLDVEQKTKDDLRHLVVPMAAYAETFSELLAIVSIVNHLLEEEE